MGPFESICIPVGKTTSNILCADWEEGNPILGIDWFKDIGRAVLCQCLPATHT